MSLGGWIFLAIIVALVGLGIATYTRLVGLRQRSEEAWSDIDVQLKRRPDLVPNLVETVKGYAAHERSTCSGERSTHPVVKATLEDDLELPEIEDLTVGRILRGFIALGKEVVVLAAGGKIVQYRPAP